MGERDPAPMAALQVIPAAESGVPIMINRSTPRCGYWDDPVDRVSPSDVHLEFVTFFDFGELGRREFRYLEARIRTSLRSRTWSDDAHSWRSSMSSSGPSMLFLPDHPHQRAPQAARD